MAINNEYRPETVTHPGVTLAAKIREMNLSVKEFAALASLTEEQVDAVIDEESPITSDMAIALEKATQIPGNFWISRQCKYNEVMSRKLEKRAQETGVYPCIASLSEFPTSCPL